MNDPLDKEFGVFAPAIIKLRIMCEKLADAEVSNETCLKAIRKAKQACYDAQVSMYSPSRN